MDSEAIRIDQNLTHKAEFLALVDQARILAGLSVKEMAINAAVPEGPFSEAFRGVRGNLAVHWLDRQPQAFWIQFIRIVSERQGLSPETQARVQITRIKELVGLLVEGLVTNGRMA